LAVAVALNNPALVLNPIRDRLNEMVMTNIPEINLIGLDDDVVITDAVASVPTDGTGDHLRV
jgi:glucokinase